MATAAYQFVLREFEGGHAAANTKAGGQRAACTQMLYYAHGCQQVLFHVLIMTEWVNAARILEWDFSAAKEHLFLCFDANWM